jgi:hypothetical protein
MATVDKVTISIANDSQCSPCLSTLLNKDICEACIEKYWYLVDRQADDDCWYNKTQFHEYFGDQCDWYWQQARKRPGGLHHPLVRECEWKKQNPRKVTHAPTIEAEAVSAPIPWQCGRPKGPVIYMSRGHVIIDGCLCHGQEDYIADSIARALKLHGVSGEKDCLVCSQRPREMLLGCGHILTCSACLEKFTHCGICKTPVTHSRKISVPDSGYAHGMYTSVSFGENNSDSEQSGSGLLSASDADGE